jgi:type II secretory pathway component PulF
MKTFPSVFGQIVVGLVAAAERTGRLDDILTRLADRQEKEERLRRAVTSALAYPVMVMGATVLMTMGFFCTIFPANQALLVSLQVEMSTAHRLLVRLVETVNSPLTPVVLLGMGGGLAVKLRSPDFKATLRRRVLDVLALIPPANQLLKKLRGFRLMEVLSLLLRGGGTVDQALKYMIAGSTDEREIQGVRTVHQRLLRGESFVDALGETNLCPPLVLSLLEVGQESGRLAEMAQKGAAMCEEDVRMTLETASTVIEPILLGVAGLVVGGGVMLTMAPMFTLLQGL